MFDTDQISFLEENNFTLNSNLVWVRAIGNVDIHVRYKDTRIYINNQLDRVYTTSLDEIWLISIIEYYELLVSKLKTHSTSEIEDKVVLRDNDEFMSRKCNLDDFIKLRANKVYQGMTLEFGTLTLFFTEDRKLFLQHGNITLKTIQDPTRNQVDEIYHFFTGEHLDFYPTKVYNWETCFSRRGWHICDDNDILDYIGDSKDLEDYPRSIYPTKEDAESVLAHCQLLHIINKINEDYPAPKVAPRYYTIAYNPTIDYFGFYIKAYCKTNSLGGLRLNSQEGAEVLIRDNEQLLKTYFKIK